MSYFNVLKKHKVTVPPFWTDQSYFLRDGFLMGFTLEFIFLYFNAYDSFTRKATIKCLERVRYSEYKLKEKAKLDLIKEEKRRKLQLLQELKDRRDASMLR
jgi:hypothetical protein